MEPAKPQPPAARESKVMAFLRKIFGQTPKGRLYRSAAEQAGLMKKGPVKEEIDMSKGLMDEPIQMLKKASKKKFDRDRTIKNTAVSLGSMGVGRAGSSVISSTVGGPLMSGFRRGIKNFEPATKQETDALKKALNTKATVKVYKTKVPVSLALPSQGTRKLQNIAFQRDLGELTYKTLARNNKKRGLPKPIKNLVALSPDMNKLPIVAHELGHSTKKFRMPAGRLLYGIGKGAPLGGIAVASIADPDSKASKYAPLAVGAASLPVLYEEGRASLMADKGLKRIGVSKKTLKAARGTLGKAYGTYLVSALAGVGGTMLARKTKKLFKNDSKKLKRIKG